MQKKWKSILIILGILWIACTLHFVLVYYFNSFHLLSFLYPNYSSDSENSFELALKVTVIQSLGIIFITATAFTWEHLKLNGKNTSLQRLLNPNTNSRRTDWFYFLLTISGVKNFLALIFGFTLGHQVYIYLQTNFSLKLLTHLDPISGFAILVLCNTFVFYLVHRIMHTKILWTLHQVHHSAEELNIITPHRNHPIDLVIVLIFNSTVAAILGASWWQNIIYIVMNGWYQQLVHTSLEWKNPFLKKVFISSQDHWIHHAKDPQLWDKNFGVLKVWDQLFGTYKSYESLNNKKIDFGLTNYQSLPAHKEIFSLYFLSFKNFFPKKKR